jgi:hypothetical protein
LKIKSQKDFWSGLLFVVAGLAFAIGALNYAFGGASHPGPGFLPLILGVLLALTGALQLFKALTIEVEGGDPIGPWAWKPVICIVGGLALFGLALPVIGLLLAVPVLVVIVSLAGDRVAWRPLLLQCVGLTLAAWLVFVAGLGWALPLWPGAGH